MHVIVGFFTARTNPTLGVSAKMGRGLSEQCCKKKRFCATPKNIFDLTKWKKIVLTFP